MFRTLLISFSMMVASTTFSQQVEKVGGTYVVQKIEQKAANYFLIEFASKDKTGRFDLLRLESDHIHISVKQGQTIRLSAEVLSENGATAEVAQVLLFLPHVQGYTPVWMLSRKARDGELRGSKYIEMHAPQSDYAIF